MVVLNVTDCKNITHNYSKRKSKRGKIKLKPRINYKLFKKHAYIGIKSMRDQKHYDQICPVRLIYKQIYGYWYCWSDDGEDNDVDFYIKPPKHEYNKTSYDESFFRKKKNQHYTLPERIISKVMNRFMAIASNMYEYDESFIFVHKFLPFRKAMLDATQFDMCIIACVYEYCYVDKEQCCSVCKKPFLNSKYLLTYPCNFINDKLKWIDPEFCSYLDESANPQNIFHVTCYANKISRYYE